MAFVSSYKQVVAAFHSGVRTPLIAKLGCTVVLGLNVEPHSMALPHLKYPLCYLVIGVLHNCGQFCSLCVLVRHLLI